MIHPLWALIGGGILVLFVGFCAICAGTQGDVGYGVGDYIDAPAMDGYGTSGDYDTSDGRIGGDDYGSDSGSYGSDSGSYGSDSGSY